MEVVDASMAMTVALPASAMATAQAHAPAAEAENIAVCIRVRPLNEREVRNKDVSVLRSVPKLNVISITDADGQPLPGKHNVFAYDHIFDERASTRAMYTRVAQRIVQSALDGINGTIFAYGQTSSGKTYTMTGTGGLPFEEGDVDVGRESMGILQLAVEDIFRFIEQSTDRDFLLRVSFVEIYNEVVKDLLNPSEKGSNLKLREDPRKGVYVESREEIITNYEDILRLLEVGNQRRTVGQTAMNERSSRSHSIFRIVIESKQKSSSRRQSEDDVTGAVLVGSLSLVDLAGSESMRHTAAEGARQREAGNINKSLLTLSRVINSLANSSAGAQNAPFRDSKLTRLLQNSLDGNTRTLIICCVTPSDRYVEETKSTLQFAARAKTIKTSATVNEVLDDQAQLKKLKREVHELKRLVNNDEVYNALKAENEALQCERDKNKAEITRLLGLVLSSSSAGVRGIASTRKVKPRHKRMRETWHPGDFPPNMVMKAIRGDVDAKLLPFGSPNPQARKRHLLDESKENIDPQNLLSALDDADSDDDDCMSNGRRVSAADSEALSRRYGASDEERAKQVVETLEAALSRRQVDNQGEEHTLDGHEDIDTRVARLVKDVEGLAGEAAEARKLAGDHEVLKMAAEELQTRLQLSKDQEEEELANTKELLDTLESKLADTYALLENERAQTAELLAEKTSWIEERERMEASMAELLAKLEVMTVKASTASSDASVRKEQLDKALREAVQHSEILKSELTEIKQAAEEMQRTHEKKVLEMEQISKREIDELSNQLQDAFVDQEELKLEKEDEITKLEEELLSKSDELEQKALEFAEREAALLGEIESLKSQQSEAVDESAAVADLTKRCQELEAENERMASERLNLMDAMVELEEQLQETTKLHAGLEAQIKSLADEKAELEAKAASLQEGVESMRLERDKAIVKAEAVYSSSNGVAQSRIQELEAEVIRAQADLEEACNDQEAEANRAEEAIKELEDARRTMNELQQKLVGTVDEVHTESTERVAALEAELQARTEQLQEKEILIKQIEAAEAEARAYKDFLQAEMDELSEKAANLEVAKTNLSIENAHLRGQLTELNTEMLQVPETLASEIEELTQGLESLRAELDSKIAQEKTWMSEVKKLTYRVNEVNDELKMKSEEITRLQETIQALDEEKSTWLQKSASSDELQAEIVRMREERWGLATKCEESEHALAKERRDLQRVAVELDELRADHTALEEESAALKKSQTEKEIKLRQLVSELDATRTEKLALEEMVTELENKFEILEIAKKSLDDSLAVRVAEVASKTSENAELRVLIEKSNAELAFLRRELEIAQQQTAPTEALQAMQERIATLEFQCTTMETEKSQMAEELEGVKGSKDALVEELSALESQLMAMSEDKVDIQSKLDSAVNELDEATNKSSEKIASIEAELRSKQDELTRILEAELTLKAERDTLREEVAAAKTYLAEKEAELLTVTSVPPQSISSAELEGLELRIEEESKRREKAELDAKSFEEALDMMRDELKHKSDSHKSMEISMQELTAAKDKTDEEMDKLRLELTRAKEEQEELRYQSQQRMRSTGEREAALVEKVENLEQELVSAREALDKTEGEWKARAQQAEEHFRRLEGELRASKSNEVEVTDKLKQLEEELVGAKDALVQTEKVSKQRAQQAEEHFRRLDAELRVANEERVRLVEQVQKTAAEEDSALEAINRLKEEKASLQAKVLELEKTGKGRESQWAEHVEELAQKAEFETSNLREQCREAQDELEAYQRYADEEITKLRASIEQNDVEMLELSRSTKQREEMLRAEAEELQSQLADAQATISKMQAKLNETDESSHALVAELSAKVEQLNARLAQAEDERSSNAEQVAKMKTAMEKLEGENYQHRNEVEELGESLKSAQMEAMHYHTQLVEVQLAKEEMEKLVDTQKKRIDKLEKVKMTTDTLEMFRKLKNDRTDLQVKVQKLEKHVKDLMASKALSKEASEQQHTRLLRLKEEEVGMLKTHIEELKSHLEELKRGVQNEKDRNADMRREMQSVVEDIRDKAQQEVEDMRAVLKEKSVQVVDLEQQLAAMAKKQDAMKEQKSSNESYLEKENLQLLVEIRQLKKRLDSRSTTSYSHSTTIQDDDLAAFEASAKEASALLAAPSAASIYASAPKTPESKKSEPEETKQEPQSATKRAPSGISSFLMPSSAPTTEAEEEEARPSCSQQ